MIARMEYLDFLIRAKDKQLIKVVSGIRSCGKSTMFDIYITGSNAYFMSGELATLL